MEDRPKIAFRPILRWLLAGVFLFAGLSKLDDPAGFLEETSRYALVPESWLPGFVWFLPCLEILLGLCLIANLWLAEALFLLLGLMLIFMVALVSAWARGLNIECGCFGAFSSGGSYWLWIIRDLLLAGGLMSILFLYQ